MTSSRIPVDLQAVFLASNSGEDVHKPPASRSAYKVFRNVLQGMKGLRARRRSSSNVSRAFSTNSSATFPSDSSHYLEHEEGQPEDVLNMSPQQWVDKLLRDRGYSTKRHNTVRTAYFNTPTKLQLASYNAKTVELCTNKRDEDALREILACGISLNACNIHGESLMHKACRLGYHQVLNVFLEFDAELKICDAQGRTLLHDTCWGARPSFQAFKLLIEREPDLLFMADCRGACPLDYVLKEHWGFWVDYLDWNADKFWPPLSETPPEPDLVHEPPHSRVIADPPNALSCDMALLVASGRMKPQEVLVLLSSASDDDRSRQSCLSSDEEDDTDYDDSCVSDEDSVSSECSLDSLEDNQLLEELGQFLSSK